MTFGPGPRVFSEDLYEGFMKFSHVPTVALPGRVSVGSFFSRPSGEPGLGMLWDEEAVRCLMTRVKDIPMSCRHTARFLGCAGQATGDAAPGTSLSFPDAPVGLPHGGHIWMPGSTDQTGNRPRVGNRHTSRRGPRTVPVPVSPHISPSGEVDE